MADNQGKAAAQMRPLTRFSAGMLILAVLMACSNTAWTRSELPVLQKTGLSTTRQSETILLQALEKLQEQHLDQAQGVLENLVRDTPDFRLAQLVYADVLAARSGALHGPGAGWIPEAELAGLEDEARRRWRYHVQRSNATLVPSHLVSMAGGSPYALVVDLNISRMYVFANIDQTPRLIDDYYISGGRQGSNKQREGDQRTPVGVYFIQQHIPGSRLPDLYGWGAFTLDYPNPLDRRQGRTGHGIWLHGNPAGMFSRPPQDSDGCVTMHNEDLEVLAPLLSGTGIPVVIAQNVEWAEPSQMQRTRNEMLTLLNQWRADWESLATPAYLNHYSRAFQSGRQDYPAWARYKSQVNASKSAIRVRLEDINIFQYPENPEIMMATFKQDYWSDTFQSSSMKQQFWQLESDGRWRIIYEGAF